MEMPALEKGETDAGESDPLSRRLIARQLRREVCIGVQVKDASLRVTNRRAHIFKGTRECPPIISHRKSPFASWLCGPSRVRRIAEKRLDFNAL